jgi:hypothetical protein
VAARVVASVSFTMTFALLMLFSFVEVGCSKHAQFYSPDGTEVLVVSYVEGGALGADYATVCIRSRWSPFATRVFNGEAAWDFRQNRLASPECKWVDNSHLVIAYYGEANCQDFVGHIQIRCVRLEDAVGQEGRR